MDLKKINDTLKGISIQIQGLEELKNEDIEKLINDIPSMMEANNAEILTFDGQKVDDETIDFNAFVTANLSKLREFTEGNGYVEYYKKLSEELNGSKPVEEIEAMVNARVAKVQELIAKLERVGNLNQVIKELTERLKNIDIGERLEKKDQESDMLYEAEHEKYKTFIKFKNDPNVKQGIEQLKAIKDKAKIEEENKDIDAKITEEKNIISKLKNNKLKDVHERNINNLKKQKEGNNKKLEELDKKIDGKTESDIINKIKARIPDDLDNKDQIEEAITGENPEQALLDIENSYKNNMEKYENRKKVNAERRKQVEIGKNARSVRQRANPITYNSDAYTLTDEELADIDKRIEENGDEVKAIRKRIENDPDQYPIPIGKDLRRQVREWIDKEEGKTRNPFKLLSRMRRVRSGEAQEQYREVLITEKIKAELIEREKVKKHEEIVKDIQAERAEKTATLDRYGNAFKDRIRKAAIQFSDKKLSGIVKEGNYNEITRNIVDQELKDEAQRDDYDFTH